MAMVSPFAAAAQSTPTFLINYDATSQYAVSDIAIFQNGPDGQSITNSFSIGVGETVIQNPFSVTDLPTDDFLLGVAENLASDGGDNQQHLVLFSNDTFAANAQNIAFGTLFPNTNEATLLNDLEVIGQSVPGDTNVAYNDLFTFQSGDAVSGPNGSVGFSTGDTFTEIAFSNGQIIGTGASFASLVAPIQSSAPEPSTWALMIAGLGGIGLMLRRVRQTAGLRFKHTASA